MKVLAPVFQAVVVLAGSALLAACHGTRPTSIGVNRKRIEDIRARWGESPSR